MKKILSICISTYNRHIFLEQLLSSIFEQVDDVPIDCIEICINDDSAGIESQYVVQKYIDLCKIDIYYHRNNMNTGMERAFLNVVKMSHGEFCWIVSDDDMISKGALKIVYENIAVGEYDLIVGDRNYFNDVTGMYSSKYFNIHRKILNNTTDYNKVLEYSFLPCTYISSLVFKKSLWLYKKLDKVDIERYRYFIHVKKIFEALPYSKKSTLFLETPIMEARAYNFSYSKNVLRVWYLYLCRVTKSLKLYDGDSINSCMKTLHEHMGGILGFRNLLQNKIQVENEDHFNFDLNIYKDIKGNIFLIQKLKYLLVLGAPKVLIRVFLKFSSMNSFLKRNSLDSVINIMILILLFYRDFKQNKKNNK